MNTDSIVYAILGICLLVIVFFAFSKPLKFLGRMLINGIIGVFAFIGMNFLLSPFSISVGINALTVLIVGILGIPGFISLYLSRLIL